MGTLIPESAATVSRAGHANDPKSARAARRRRWWRVGAAEARAHAVIVGVVLWTVAGIGLLAGSGYRSVFGPLKGADFVQFYTVAHLDADTARRALYDPEAFHRIQTTLVPESTPDHYLMVYPPHVWLLFRPFAGLSYGVAFGVWSAVLAVGYALCVWLAWRPFRMALTERGLIVAAAAAFPPFWYLILHGQTTIVPMLAFCLGWLALERGRSFWAGAVFGLLFLKPQFALVLVPVVLFGREWRMLLGATASVAVQMMGIVWTLGFSAIEHYVAMVTRYRDLNLLLEPRPAEMHSISAVTNRLPGYWGVAIWTAAAGLIVIKAIGVWRSPAPVSMRMACLVVASILVNPHVFVYDVTVLVLPLIWSAGFLYQEGRHPNDSAYRFSLLIYALYLTLLAPTARVAPGAQASVLVIAILFNVASAAAMRCPLHVPACTAGGNALLPNAAERGGADGRAR